ncbi:ROK family transcriptional regulator [Sphingomonas mucosissima]|uniref:Beta-glucoside kinase n=1 Tax=Sphingomonas mucosissima TaxID=370959 RepID=A0A245ZQJ2_9SPHN|nr:ROK family transcriptional regulator [Sphingomonas mucosissima]OWK31990.1 beta-glucoside kinase [Sphingomonas mucosissima]
MVPTPTELPGRALSPNERRVLDILLRGTDVTRANITHLTGLTAQSSMRLVGALEERGLIRSGDPVARGRGQPSRYLELVAEAAFTIGLSITTDKLAAVLFNFRGESVAEIARPLTDAGSGALLGMAQAMIDALCAAHPVTPGALSGIGIAIAGYFVGDGRRVNTPASLEPLALIDLEQTLGERLGLPVLVENDGNAAAIGESLAGLGRQYRTLAYFYFADGFGGGLVIDGAPWRGANGNAGEIGGFLPPEVYPPPTLSALRAIVAEEGAAFDSLDRMLAGFDPGLPGVDRWITTVAPTLSMIASAAATLLDPDAIVLGGRIPASLAERLAPHIRIFNRGRRDQPRPGPRILPGTARHDAAATGAAALLMKELFFT